MAVNVSKSHRAFLSADIDLVDAAGVVMVDEDGVAASATMHSPATKQYAQALAEVKRRKADRVAKQGGKLSAAFDDTREDVITFLGRVIIKFNNIDHEDAEKKGLILAILEDDQLGYIREYLDGEAGKWSRFTKGSASN